MSRGEEKRRLQIQATERTCNKLAFCVEELDAASDAEAARRAIDLMYDVLHAKKRGRRLQVVDEAGTVTEILLT